MVETDVHFPTDINLHLDAIRKVIEISAELSETHNLPGWRQHHYHQRQFKKQYRKVQRLKHSTSKDESKHQRKEQEIKDTHRAYLDLAEWYLTRADHTRQQISPHDPLSVAWLSVLNEFMGHSRRQINRIDRLVLRGEHIPNGEKVFSQFQPHTERISKGKASVPVELGLRVFIMVDQDRFILHHRAMIKTTDDQVAFAMVGETKQKVPTLRAVSMDKGFSSPANQEVLKSRLEGAVLRQQEQEAAQRKRGPYKKAA